MAEEVQARAALRSFDPVAGTVIGEVAASSPADVREVVARAREAAPSWAALGVEGRARALREVRHLVYERMDDILDTICAENGKPRAEALSQDVLPSLMTLKYLELIAPRALKAERAGPLVAPLMGLTSRIEWRPFGVVGCISPWNYPMLLSFMAITPALLAGNSVVLKPSELTPSVGERIREVLRPLPDGVATVVQGGADVGAALVDAPCDKLCFIGSAAVGRKIAEGAARHLTPVVMELGGQDAAIVCADADLDVASSGVLFGAFLNAGQACCAIERVYVVDSVADRFEQLLVSKLARVRQGAAGAGRSEMEIGPLTVPRQLELVRRHVADAVSRGAKVLAGGPDGRAGRDGLWYAPSILEGRSEDMAMFSEETFGPVLPVVRVRDEEEAVRRANEEGANLTASVWTGDAGRGRALASRIKAGTITINDHAVTAAAPWGLWGGVGASGYGRLSGKLGLRELAAPVHVATNAVPRLKRLWWYPYDQPTTRSLRALADALSAPKTTQRLKAVMSLAANAGRSL